jgi:outer membrane protein assembly factor BamB
MLGIVGVMTAAALTGCKTDQSTGSPMVDSESLTDLGYRVQWIQDLGLRRNEKLGHLQVLGDRIVTLDRNNIATVVGVGDGRILWRNPVGSESELFSDASRRDNVLLLTTQSRAFTRNINNGDELRQFRLSYASSTPPIIVGEQLIVGSPTGMLYAQDLDHGLLKWHYKMESAISTAPLLIGPTLIITTASGHVAAFNPSNGNLLWREQTFGRISARPSANESIVFVAGEDQSLYAYDRASGRHLWRYYATEALHSSPWIVPDSELVLQRVGRDVFAINIMSGKVAWKLENFAGDPVLVRKGAIYFHQPGRLSIINVADGKLIHATDTPGVQAILTDNPRNGALFLIRPGAQIVKLVQR